MNVYYKIIIIIFWLYTIAVQNSPWNAAIRYPKLLWMKLPPEDRTAPELLEVPLLQYRGDLINSKSWISESLQYKVLQ